MATENVTTKFKVDINDLKKNITNANKQIKLLTAEMKNANAGMKKGEENANSLTTKIQKQTKVVEQEEKKLDALKQQLARLNQNQQEGEKIIADLTAKHSEAAKTYGEASDEAKAYAKQLADAQAAQERNAKAADDLKIKIVNQDTAVKNAQAQVNNYRTALNDLEKESDEAANATETLTEKVDRQESELKDLKQRYVEVATEQGDTSDKARELASQISELSGKLAEDKTKLNDAEKAADKFDKSLEDVDDSASDTTNGGLSAFGVALGNLAADIISNVISKMKDLITETVNVGNTFDTSMSKVGAVSGANAEELEALTAKAKEMGATTKFTASEAADAFNYMAMAGWKTEDMIDGIGGILNLAAASGSDLAATSDIVTDALTAMGYSAGDAGKLADVMAAASSNANTNVELMGQTFQYAAPIVGALGYSMEDTAVAIGLMANAGIKGEKAGTALRSMLTRLSAPPKECAAAMEELGISMTDSEGNMKSLDEIMQDLRTAFDGLSETEQTAAAKHIAGAEAMSGLLSIVNAAPEDFEKLTNAVENSEGAAENMANAMLDNLGGDMTLLSSKFEGIQLAIYDKFEPALRAGADALDKLLDGIQWLVDHSTEVIAALGGMAAAVAVYVGYTTAITVMTKGWKALTIVTKAQAAAQWLLNTAMNANPIGLIVAAIAGLVAAFVILWKKSDKFRNFWKGLWDGIKKTTGAVFDAIKGFFTSLWATVQPVVEVVKGAIETAITEIREMFTAAWGAIKAIWDLVEPYFSMLWEFIKGIFLTNLELIKGYFLAAWEAIKGVWDVTVQYFTMIWENIKVIFSAVKNTLLGFFKAAWVAIKVVWDGVTGYFKMIWNNIKAVFSVVKSVLTGDFSGAWQGIKDIWDNTKSYFESVWKNIKGVFSAVKEFFKTAFSNAWEAVKGVFGNVGKFFSGVWNTIKSTFSSIGTKVADAIGGAFKTAINAVIATVEKAINLIPNAINKAIGAINKLPGVSISKMDTISLPRLAKGGIVNRPTVAEIGENGQEAVIPLENNKAGLKKVASLLANEMTSGAKSSGKTVGGNTYNFNQTNNSPKALSRWEIYRQTKNLINAAKGV